jgi:hypothetical protein
MDQAIDCYCFFQCFLSRIYSENIFDTESYIIEKIADLKQAKWLSRWVLSRRFMRMSPLLSRFSSPEFSATALPRLDQACRNLP